MNLAGLRQWAVKIDLLAIDFRQNGGLGQSGTNIGRHVVGRDRSRKLFLAPIGQNYDKHVLAMELGEDDIRRTGGSGARFVPCQRLNIDAAGECRQQLCRPVGGTATPKFFLEFAEKLLYPMLGLRITKRCESQTMLNMPGPAPTFID